jgi:hypothetical protein
MQLIICDHHTIVKLSEQEIDGHNKREQATAKCKNAQVFFVQAEEDSSTCTLISVGRNVLWEFVRHTTSLLMFVYQECNLLFCALSFFPYISLPVCGPVHKNNLLLKDLNS